MNYYEHHLGDYAKDTLHLTMLEHGAYRLLLDRYYNTEKGIPAEDVHRYALARSPDEIKAVDNVLREYFQLVDGLYINGRSEEEIEKARKRIESAKENGKKGGRKKTKPDDNPDETQTKPSGFLVGSENGPQQPKNQNPDGTHRVLSGFEKRNPDGTQIEAHQTPSTRHQTPIGIAADTREGAEITQAMQDELFEAAGNSLNLPGAPNLMVMARPLHWIEIGADWQRDVLPTIRVQAGKGRPFTINSWNYFDGPIADAIARRTRPMPEGKTDERSSNRATAGDTRYSTSLAALAASGDQ